MTDELIQKLSQWIAEALQSAPGAASVEQLVDRLKQNEQIREIVQNNAPGSTGFQTFVAQGGTANIGIHLHNIDEEKLGKVLREFWKSLQPREVPNNVPRSGVKKFIGREPELERLHTQLQQGSLVAISAAPKPAHAASVQTLQEDRSLISAVEGMGGVGKTELAIQYTQKYASVYEGGIAWLFSREFNVGTQVVGFAQSRLNLKIPEGLELSDQVAFCWRNWREGEVLLVLDDVVNYGRDVEPYLPPQAASRFKILMTTRLKFGPPIQSISLDVLSPEQALELLTVLIGSDRVQQELDIANTLCKWLEYLPLGIELVGRYLLKRADLSLANLLSRLEKKVGERKGIKHDSLKRDEATGTSTARRGVEAAFELSWEELDSPSQHLGKLLSLFAVAPIPWYLVESVEKKYCENSDGEQEFDEEVFENARTKLLELHLLQLSQQQEQIYRLHSLIREFFRSKLEGEEDIEVSNQSRD